MQIKERFKFILALSKTTIRQEYFVLFRQTELYKSKTVFTLYSYNIHKMSPKPTKNEKEKLMKFEI